MLFSSGYNMVYKSDYFEIKGDDILQCCIIDNYLKYKLSLTSVDLLYDNVYIALYNVNNKNYNEYETMKYRYIYQQNSENYFNLKYFKLSKGEIFNNILGAYELRLYNSNNEIIIKSNIIYYYTINTSIPNEIPQYIIDAFIWLENNNG
jgi:hypothetical protein